MCVLLELKCVFSEIPNINHVKTLLDGTFEISHSKFKAYEVYEDGNQHFIENE